LSESLTKTGGPDRGAPLLSCRGVSKYFGAMAAVKDLSFDLREGEIFGIGGPNGAGKTTLFEVISGLSPADRGEVVFDGRDITAWAPEAICHAGLARVFQSNAAFDSLTVAQNVVIGSVYGHTRLPLVPLRIDRAAYERVQAALELVGLIDKAGQRADRLPVIDRKLLMFASAIASEPKLLMLDEPVGGLNPHEIERIQRLVRDLAGRGTTIILIEHVMRFMVQLAERVMIMHHGEKIFEGPAAQLPRDPTVASVYLGERAARRLTRFIEQTA